MGGASRHQPGQSRRPGPATRGGRRRCRRRAPRRRDERGRGLGGCQRRRDRNGWVGRSDRSGDGQRHDDDRDRAGDPLSRLDRERAVGDESSATAPCRSSTPTLGAGGHVTDRRHARRARRRPRFGVAGTASRRRRAANRSGRGARSGGATRHRTRRRRELGHHLPALLRSPAARPSFSRPTSRTVRRRGRSSRPVSSRHTRVCASDRVGIADRDQAGQAGPAATAAGDLHAALGEIGEHGPFVDGR